MLSVIPTNINFGSKCVKCEGERTPLGPVTPRYTLIQVPKTTRKGQQMLLHGTLDPLNNLKCSLGIIM